MAAAGPILLLITALSLLFCALATTPVPASIEVPQEHPCKLQQTVHAKGYQYYRFNGTAWLFFNASARLYNSEKQQVGHHFYLAEADAQGGQPTWESLPSKKSDAVPYSRVTCKPVSKEIVDQDSIQWVLLQSTQCKGDKTYFGDVAFVQRINTKLGLAPTTTKGAREGEVKKSPYSADYKFYVSEANH
ncbi:hypothetical protein M758_10G004100 [Ceratodon purpureus]|uniref:Uncharacterized protein n=1 Tax=Ceratodon purpureus TaxID=3225 RepID=A0A8T0GGG5_CERPU|nr:hypothetical protein KC19_10G005300 [Ceratodon purpureus]KAG0602282.1 hypothetical protein M758_10G004100 [Ceratodon purpureus]